MWLKLKKCPFFKITEIPAFIQRNLFLHKDLLDSREQLINFQITLFEVFAYSPPNLKHLYVFEVLDNFESIF